MLKEVYVVEKKEEFYGEDQKPLVYENAYEKQDFDSREEAYEFVLSELQTENVFYATFIGNTADTVTDNLEEHGEACLTWKLGELFWMEEPFQHYLRGIYKNSAIEGGTMILRMGIRCKEMEDC